MRCLGSCEAASERINEARRSRLTRFPNSGRPHHGGIGRHRARHHAPAGAPRLRHRRALVASLRPYRRRRLSATRWTVTCCCH